MSDENAENKEEQKKDEEVNPLAATVAEMQAELTRMREHQDKLLDEKKAEQRKAQDAIADAEVARLAKAEKENDFKELFADSEKKREELELKLKDQASSIESSKHKAAAMKIAAGLTKDTKKASDLAEKIMRRTKLGDDGLKVLNEQGELTISPVETLTEDLKTSYPYLVDGSQASGGGAQGSGNNNTHDSVNEKAEAAKKDGDIIGMINARLQQNLKGKS